MNTIKSQTPLLDELLADNERQPYEWSQPDSFDLKDWSSVREVEDRLASGAIRTVVDPINHIAEDLYELNHPDSLGDVDKRTAFVQEVKAEGSRFGTWFHFPWSGELVRFPDREDHRAMRTFRNRPLISDKEQAMLYDATVAVFGLSVGSNVVENLSTSGIGGRLILADSDTMSPANLNRIHGTFPHVGMHKIDHTAIKISEVDPYVEQVHLRDGVTEDNLRDVAELRPAVVFDEIDNLPMKALIRQFGQKESVPVIMATDVDDTSIVDIERYDTENPALFNGRLTGEEIEMLTSGSISPQERGALTVKLVGMEHITPRLGEALGQIGITLAGLPQLGTTAAIGGGHGAVYARNIIIGRDVSSGRYIPGR